MEKLKRKQLEAFRKSQRAVAILLVQKERIEAQNRGIDGMPKGRGIGDPSGNMAAALADVEWEIRKAKAEYIVQRNAICEWLFANVPANHQHIVISRIVERIPYSTIGKQNGKCKFSARDIVLKYVDTKAKILV